MKRLCPILFAATVMAAPVGNPATPGLITNGIFTKAPKASARIGYEGDFVFNGRMEQGDRRVDNYTQKTESGTVTLNLFNRWDIYGVFGASDTKTDWRFINAGSIFRMELETEYNFLWAVGSRAIYYQWKNICLGVGGRYSSSHYQPKRLYQNGIDVPVTGTHYHWREWQFNTDISYKICYFTPYIGIKYSNAKANIGAFSVPLSPDGSGNARFDNKDPVGIYLGCGISSGDYLMVNLEGRLIDEEAVSVFADIRF